MFSIFVDVLAPVFAIVAVGLVAGRRLSLDARTLASLGYWVLGPVFMFDALSRPDLAADVIAGMAAAAGAGMIGAALIGYGLARILGRPSNHRAAVVTTAIFGNTGNFGLAIVAFAVGEQALPLAAVVMVMINTVGIVVGVASSTGQRSGVWSSVRTALTAPMTLAVPLALAVNMGDVVLPLWLDRSVSLVAASLIPLMLLTLGMQLASMGRPHISSEVTISLVAKLAVAPAAAAAAVGWIGLSGDPARVVVLQSAMPAAVFSAMIAMEHDLAPGLVTTIVLVGTLVSVVTLPVVIALTG